MKTYFQFSFLVVLTFTMISLGNQTTAQELPYIDTQFQTQSQFTKSLSGITDSPERVTIREGTFQNRVGSAHAINGRWIAVGAGNQSPPGTGNRTGMVFLYERQANGNLRLHQELVPSNLNNTRGFGDKILFHGNTLFIGASSGQSQAIYIFERAENGNWTEAQIINKPSGLGSSLFGHFMDTDGFSLIVGTFNEGAYLYQRQQSGWNLVSEVTVPGFDGDLSPHVAILGRLNVAVMSTSFIHILSRSGGNFTEIQRISIPSPDILDLRQLRIASSGGTFAISNLRDEELVRDGGAVYFFERNSANTWVPTDTLRPANIANRTTFGTSLAFDGNRILIGNYGDNTAHLYKRAFNQKWSHVVDIEGVMESVKEMTVNQPSIAIQDNILLTGHTRSTNGESFLFEIETDFEPLSYFNNALAGDPVFFPTVKWLRGAPFNNIGMSFAVSGRNAQGQPETRAFFAVNPNNPNQFNLNGTFVANIIAQEGGLHWVRPDKSAEPYFFISGYPADLREPNRAAFFNMGATVTEVPSNLPNIGGVAAWADLNGNGKLDVVLSGFKGSYFDNAGATRIMLNTGNMNFEEVIIPEVETRQARAILVYDFFNRGKNDILLVGLPRSTGGGGENLLIKNMGDGNFEADPDSPLSVGSPSTFMQAAAMGDLTNNGHMDIVIGGWASGQQSPLGIWWNNGDGTFDRSYFGSIPLARNFGVRLEITDITNNGYPDIIHVGDNDNSQSSATVFLMNAGDRSLSIASPNLPNMRRGGLTAGDITMDGKVEFLAYGSDNKNNPVLTTFRNSYPEQLYTRPPRLNNVQITLNDDEQVIVRWDPGTDGITPTEALTYNVRMSTSDLPPDLDDIVESMSFFTGVLRTKGPGNAGARTEFTLPPIEPGKEIFVSVSAVNQHGLASDFSTTRWNSSNRFIALADVDTPVGAQDFHPHWVDINRDGNLDLAFRNRVNERLTPAISVFDISEGSFVPLEGEVFGSRAIWADFNNNGWPDAAFVSGNNLTLALNNEDETFSHFSSEGVGIRINDFDLIDYNNDGKMGIVVASGSLLNEDSSKVVRHIGNGALEITDIVLPPALSVAVADHNRNGCKDLLLQVLDDEQAIDQLKVFANDCDGNFTEIALLVDGGFTHYALWGDVSANGFPDVIAVVSPDTDDGSETFDIHVFPNQGNGEFGDAVVFEGFETIRPILVDITGNGYLDILINGGNSGNRDRASALFNTGSPDVQFEPAVGIAIYENGMMAAADVFNSGRADVFIGGNTAFGFNAAIGSNLYRNFTAQPHQPAGAPVNLDVDVDEFVTFSWSAGEAGSTPADGVTYNLRVGTQPGADDVFSSLALESGKRLVARPGNVGSATSVTLKGLRPNTSYYWSVQAIDNVYNGSEFAEERTFVSSPVSLEGGLEFPAEVSLSQNYPNPFNPTTTIRFGLPVSDRVTLTVYDITGRVVSRVADAHFDAGFHVVNFDGSRLASGVYLYRLQTGNTILTQKMSLIK